MKRRLALSLCLVALGGALCASDAHADLLGDLRNWVNQAKDRVNQGVNEIRNLDQRLGQLGDALRDLGNQALGKGREAADWVRKIASFVGDKVKEGLDSASNLGDLVEQKVFEALSALGGWVFQAISADVTKELGDLMDAVSGQLTSGTRSTNTLGESISRMIAEKVDALADRAVAWAMEQTQTDAATTVAAIVSAIPVVGEKIVNGILNGYQRGLSALRIAVVQSILAVVGPIVKTFVDKLGGASVAAIAGVKKVLEGIGFTQGLITEAMSKIATVFDCLRAGAMKEKSKYLGLLKQFISSPVAALSTLANELWGKLSRTAVNAWDAVRDIVKMPVASFFEAPKSNAPITPDDYKRVMNRQIPEAIARVAKTMMLNVPDRAFEALKKTVAGEFPMSCLMPFAEKLYKENRGVLNSALTKIADIFPELWETVMGDKLPWLFGKVLSVLNEVIKYDSTVQKILSAVDRTFRNKLPRMTRMITEARKLLKNKSPAALATARRLADELKHDVPFLNMAFWLELVKDPIKDALKYWLVRIPLDFLEPIVAVVGSFYTTVIDLVVQDICNSIPAIQNISGTVVKVITWIANDIVWNTISNALMRTLTKVVSWVGGKVIDLVVDGVFGLLNKGAAAIDDMTSTLTTQVRNQIPLTGPIGALVSGVRELYDRYIKPYLGTMQEHVTFISELVGAMAADPACQATDGATKPAAARSKGGAR